MSEPPARRFALLRHFTGASLVVILATCVAAGITSAWLVRGVIGHLERDEADNLAEYFVTEFAQDGWTRELWGRQPLPADAHARALEDMQNFGINELTLIAPEGEVLYTVAAPGAAPSPRWTAGLAEALAGRGAVRWERSEARSEAGGEVAPGAVESYVPVRAEGRIVAVAKVRRDLSPVMARATRAIPALVVVSALAGLAIFGALWLLVRRADRIIGLQHGELTRARAALEERNRRLEALNRKKDDFYAMCSHDLRSPLLSAHAASRLVLGDKRFPLAPSHKELLRENMQNVEGVLALIDDLLDLARMESHEDHLDLAPFDVAGLLRSVVTSHRLLAVTHGMTIEEIYPEGESIVVADRLKLLRVFGNLVANAVKHGGGRPVRVALDHIPGGVRVTVRDEGPGIPPEVRESLFERFARSGPAAGTGLGLAIVREYVERHGGSVCCVSEPGRGSTFVVEIPDATIEARRMPA